MIFNEDDSHFFGGGVPPSREKLNQYVDRLSAAGKVTHFFMCVNAQKANFPSKVLEAAWEYDRTVCGKPTTWGQNLKKLHDGGIDPYDVWIRRCREKNVSPWISIRMNDVHYAFDMSYAGHSSFWREHPEFWRQPDATKGDWGLRALNYSNAEVRARILAFVVEVLERYDVDGIECDWMRFTDHLTPNHELEESACLTELMSKIRQVVREASVKRAHPISIAARVDSDPEAALLRGTDPFAWASAGSIDILIPCNFFASADFWLPCREWIRRIRQVNPLVKVVPGTDSGIVIKGTKKRRLMTIEEYCTWAERVNRQGTDGAYVFNFFQHPLNGPVWNFVVDEGLAPASVKRFAKDEAPDSIRECNSVLRRRRPLAGAKIESGLPLLFADDSVLTAQTNVTRIVHSARRDDQPVLRPDPSRDGERIYVYGSVWPDGKDRKMLWYGAGSKVCLASSTNGVDWVRNEPTVVTQGFHSPSVIVDRFEKDPARRYKLVGSQFHNGADGKVDRERTGYYTACSPDGIHWSEPRQIVQGWWDTVTMAQNPRTGEILVYHKRQTPWRGFGSCRLVYLTKSNDFEHWSEPELVFAPDEADNQGWIDRPDQRMEIYNFSVLPHAGGFLAFPTMFHVTGMIKNPVKDQAAADGYVDVQLATSADGVHWSRTPGRRTIIPLGRPGSFDGGTILGVSNSALTTDDETMMYYTAMTTSHSGVVPEKKFSIGRATWRRHGWVSLAAKGRGSFTTVPLTLATSGMTVNFRTLSPNGSVRLTVRDVSNAGRTVATGATLKGDGTRTSITWVRGIRPPVGESVTLHFELDRAEVYAVEGIGKIEKRGGKMEIAEKIAASHKILRRDTWYGFPRTVFEFEGHTAWVVEPNTDPAQGAPWTWTMQWAEAYVDRQGCLDLLRRGWRHVTIDTFEHRMDDEGIRVSRDFQRFLVEKLGFASKANLIGMSWGGFFSCRYANAHPDCVCKIYLDAPLLNFDGFCGDAKKTPTASAARVGPWASAMPEDGNWSADPRMPINMASALAAAKIPILLLYGGQDQTVSPKMNCELFASRFRDSGGVIRVIKRGLYGHHPHGEDPDKTGSITDFFTSDRGD